MSCAVQQSNQRFALTLLDKMGHSVVLAENGQEAVDKWRATLANLPTSIPFDICLMDLSMPVCLIRLYFTGGSRVTLICFFSLFDYTGDGWI